jgi:hypothetical protein
MAPVFAQQFSSKDARSTVGGVTILKVRLLSLNSSFGQTDVSTVLIA